MRYIFAGMIAMSCVFSVDARQEDPRESSQLCEHSLAALTNARDQAEIAASVTLTASKPLGPAIAYVAPKVVLRLESGDATSDSVLPIDHNAPSLLFAPGEQYYLATIIWDETAYRGFVVLINGVIRKGVENPFATVEVFPFSVERVTCESEDSSFSGSWLSVVAPTGGAIAAPSSDAFPPHISDTFAVNAEVGMPHTVRSWVAEDALYVVLNSEDGGESGTFKLNLTPYKFVPWQAPGTVDPKQAPCSDR